MERCVITSAARTPVGSFLGGLKEIPVERLASIAIEETMKRSRLEAGDIDDIVMGQVLSTGEAPNIARSAGLLLGLEKVPGMTVNRLCGSGMQAIAIAASSIRLGTSRIVIAGGAESLSRAPYYLPLEARYNGLRNGSSVLKCANETSHYNAQPFPLYPQVHMGVTAENIVKRYSIPREVQDQLAFDSQRKTRIAQEKGRLAKEIVSVSIETKKGPIIVSQDEHPRPDTTLESLARLRPVFIPEGTITAGNASGMNDGGSALVLMSERECRERKLPPLAEFIDYTVSALDPMLMGLGPVQAIRLLLARNGLSLEDIGLLEINEAFAGQLLGCMHELGISLDSKTYERMNVNGGAIALGHPLGMTGARLITTLAYELSNSDYEYGIASACIGGGQGIAALLKKA